MQRWVGGGGGNSPKGKVPGIAVEGKSGDHDYIPITNAEGERNGPPPPHA